MSRNPYTCRSIRAARRWGCAALIPLLAGCSFSSIGADAPATTGSLVEPVVVQRPLPQTLAFSDAARIGQAARAALWQAEGGEPEGWVNARTGSSGTLTAEAGPADAGEGAQCRPFSTTVTSLGGVHQYSGTLCRRADTQTVVAIQETAL